MEDKKINLELLKAITACPGISSREAFVAKILKEEYDELGLRTFEDGIGSLVARDEGCDIKVMVAAHMDEVGFIVKEIDDKGFIRLQNIGSIWPAMLMGQWYTVTTAEGKTYNGLIGSIASHGLSAEKKSKVLNLDELYLDLGICSKEEAEKLGIRIGDMITPWSRFEVMNNPNYVSAKAFDDRIGSYIMLEVAKRIKGLKHGDIYFANTVQEEPGLRGARTATDMVHPDIAFAIDTTLAGDTPLNNNICSLGNGVVLSMIDSNSIAPRALVRYVRDICEQHNIKYQYAVFNGGGTDSGNIHKSFEGILNMTLSIPIRYMHTNSSIINLRDVEGCIDLITKLILDLDLAKFNELLK